jgi:hypothetical protein
VRRFESCRGRLPNQAETPLISGFGLDTMWQTISYEYPLPSAVTGQPTTGTLAGYPG